MTKVTIVISSITNRTLAFPYRVLDEGMVPSLKCAMSICKLLKRDFVNGNPMNVLIFLIGEFDQFAKYILPLKSSASMHLPMD